jgi:hypothetical protein
MATALNYAGVPAANLGVTIEETAGTIALLAKNGIIGEQAGTGLRGMLSSLTSPSKAARDEMDALGISLFDAQGNFIGLDGMAGQLQKSMSGLTQEERANALGRIFGNAQLQAANVLYREGASGVREWTKAVDDEGYAADTAAIKLDNLKGDLEALRGSLETAAIGTGEGAQTPLRSLVQNLTGVVNAYNKVPGSVQGAAASLLGITSITGGALWFGSKVIVGVNKTREALDNLPPSASKAASGLRTVSLAAAGLAVLDVASQQLNDLVLSMDRTAPSTDRLSRNLDHLGSNPTLAIAALHDELGDLGGILDDANDGLAQNLGSTVSWLDKIPLVGGMAANQIENLDALTISSLQHGREAQATFSALQESLMQLAEAQGPRVASREFNKLAASYDLTASQQSQLLNLMPAFRDMLKDAGDGAHSAGKGIEDLLNPLTEVEDQFHQTTSAAEAFKVQLEALNGFLDKRDAIRNYQAALDDFRKNFKAAAGFNVDIDPGRENQAKLDAIASSAAQVASHLKGVARTEFIGNVISQLRTMAKDMDLPKGAVDELVRHLRNLGNTKAEGRSAPTASRKRIAPSTVSTTHFNVLDALAGGPTLNAADHASGPISWVANALHNLDGDVATVTVRTVRETINKTLNFVESGAGLFDGKAAGGPVEPGRPYWVGEEGPELAVFAQPAHIIPHRESMRVAAGGVDARTARPAALGGAAGTVTVVLPPGMKIGGILSIPGIGRGELIGEVMADTAYAASVRDGMGSGRYDD